MPPAAPRRQPAALLALAATLLAAPATAQVCAGSPVPVGADGRVLGHLPYGDAPAEALAPVPAALAVNPPCLLRREVLPDLERLLAAANGDPQVAGQLRALSCQRPLSYQQSVFCRPGRDLAVGARAISVAPPGHSEHATGYALDFAVRPANGCPDAEACMAATPAFKWLVANAPRYGFEMSFPISNRQNVKWEPWHWRWVGVSPDAPGAARARFIFARARRDFPANPAVAPEVIVIARVETPPVWLGNVPAPLCNAKGKCKPPRRPRK